MGLPVRFLQRVLNDREAVVSGQIMVLRLNTLAGKFAVGLFIARFMGLEDLGLYGLVAGACVIVPSIIRTGMLGLVSRDIVGHTPTQAVQAMGHYWLFIAAFYGLVVSLALVTAWASGHFAFVAMAVPVILFEHLVLDLFMFLGSRGRFLRANLLVFVQSAAWIYLFMMMAWFVPEMRSIPMLMAAWAMGGVTAFVIGLVSLRHYPWRTFRPVWGWFGSHVPRGLNLWISDLSVTATPLMDRYVVGGLLGLQMAGVYVLFWQMANAVATLATNGVMQVYRPRIIEAFDKGNHALYRHLYWVCIRRTLLGALVMVVGLAVAVPLVIPFTRQPLAMDYLPLLWLILLGMMVRVACDLAGYGQFTRRQDMAFSMTSLAGLVLSFVLNMALVGQGGMYAAATVIVVVYAAVIALRMWLLRKPG